MYKFVYRLFPFLQKGKNVIVMKNVTDSTIGVNVFTDSTITYRADFKITEEWFEKLLAITYDDEIKSKYIPDIHQSSDFQEKNLRDILDFTAWKHIFTDQIKVSHDALKQFNDSYRNFYQLLNRESINITNPDSSYIVSTDFLKNQIPSIIEFLSQLTVKYDKNKYSILDNINDLKEIPIDLSKALFFKIRKIEFSMSWSEFLDSRPSDYLEFSMMFQHYDDACYSLYELNKILSDFKSHFNHKIIVGNAGMGKTHLSAFLINSIKHNNDLVIFLKPKLFSGDDINFEERLLQLLHVPSGYTLSEVLSGLNAFAKRNNKRCFILIDALNETTKASIGFSNIWKVYLQNFINQVANYSHLYFICTLRTSYIEQIWSVRPSEIIEIKGFNKYRDVEEACEKYFNYYKIRPTNWIIADLSYFKIPLLLDLFCKFLNEQREEWKEVNLDIHTYVKVFYDYIQKLIEEVQEKLNLQKVKPIVNGFARSADKFLSNNAAAISVDDFSDAFDEEDSVTRDKSIARAVLEGYLIFIKDIVSKHVEIVKHTQQEVGGYLLAKKLCDDFPITIDLVNSRLFKEKIVADDESKHHQLRLDILKFLIALKPDIIKHLNDKNGIRLSWWYLYNGYAYNPDTTIEDYLLKVEKNEIIFEDILNASSKSWFDPVNPLNFNFIAPLLDKLDEWEYEKEWTFYIYNEEDFFHEFVDDNIRRIKNSDGSEFDYFKIVAKFLSYVTSTNIRELRDLATIYLLEFGKKFPLSLLELTEYSAELKDSYIYERLASCCYGVMLNLQNSEQYIEKDLPVIARCLYDLQFTEKPKASTYNYLVIDSIKHLVDFALLKNVIDLNEEEKRRIANYEFTPPYDWIPPSDEQLRIINQSNYRSYPDPINMDFGIYTIPRLIDEKKIGDREAISNIYKRIFELGYKSLEKADFDDERFRDFYWGNNIYGLEGKVDRLGKKYDWKAFFDYAGFLLLHKQLNVFDKNDSAKEHYERLSDVDIDISMPNLNYKVNTRLYHGNLLAEKASNPEWYKEVFINTITTFLEIQFDSDKYIMLYGKIDQRLNEEYKVRSFLITDTFFVKKDNQIEKLKQSIANKVFSWDMEVHYPLERLRHVYFGELYWADNFYEYESETISIPTGDSFKVKRIINFNDIMRFGRYDLGDEGKEVEETHAEKLFFQSEATLSEYLWESEGKILKGHSEYYPSIKMGKELGLKAEPSNGKILDANLRDCYVCVEHKDKNFFSNEFNYMRSDLVRKYMSDNNLLLVYQVKQHSYDMDYQHNRSMMFYIIE